MYRWQPGKWLQYAIVGAGLPWVAAGWLSSDSLMSDISHRAAAAAGDWAKVELDGRDARISGTATSQDIADNAAKAVASTYGVRTVDASGVKVIPPVPPPAPTVESVTVSGDPQEVKGTWPEGQAKALDVTVDNKAYSLGKDQELSTAGGNWDLKLSTPLPPGSYDVTAKATDSNNLSSESQPGKLTVPEPPPPPPPLAAPTIDTPQVEAGKAVTLSGTWPAEAKPDLTVGINDKSYELGKDADLQADSGKWTLAPKDELAPGHYSVTATVTSPDGQSTKAETSFDIAAQAPAPAPEPAPAPAPAPQPLAAPTLDPITVNPGKPLTLSGTWPGGDGSSLTVALNDKTMELGKDSDLSSDVSGKWSMTASDLMPGHYDVTVTAKAGDQTAEAKGAFDIPSIAVPVKPATPPPAPTVETASSDSDHPTVKGTWPAATGNQLQVELDGVTHTLNQDQDLKSDDSGHWSLTPDKPVVNGTYDVTAKVTDSSGQSSVDTTTNELTVAVAPPPPPPPPAQPYDCEGTLARIAAVFPIRFSFDHADLEGPYPTALEQYAALLKDKRCESIESAGGGPCRLCGFRILQSGAQRAPRQGSGGLSDERGH